MGGFPSIKVALFSDSALPILNGVSMSIDALVRELRERGHSVHLWTTHYPGYRETDPNVHRFWGAFTPFAPNYPLAFPPFYPWFAEFQKAGFDVVHTHTPFTVGFVGLRWAESCGLPIVSTYHTNYDRYAHYVPLLPSWYVRFKIAKHTNYYYNRVDAAITPSPASEAWLLSHSVRRPVHVIPTGVPKPRPISRAEAREALGILPGHRVMLYVGRMAAEKNLTVLVEAAALVMKQDPTARLIMVGDGAAIGDAARLARELGIGDKVRLEGPKARADVDIYYAAADLFLFASITETQGLVVVEAMTYGAPPVVVEGGGASGPVKHGVNGLVSRNSPDRLAELALSVLHDDALAAKLSRGALAEGRNWTVEAMADRIIGVYQWAMQERSRGSTPLNDTRDHSRSEPVSSENLP